MAERRSVENKGNPAGRVADQKGDSGIQSDIKEKGRVPGAEKKARTLDPTLGTTGGHSRKRGHKE